MVTNTVYNTTTDRTFLRERQRRIFIKRSKKDTVTLVDLVGNAKEFENMRTDEVNIEVFGTFVDCCSAHFYTSLDWRHRAYNTKLSEVLTESDEVIAILLLENNRDNFRCYDMQLILTRKEANPKYTNVDSSSEHVRSWNTKSVRRYNALVLIVKKLEYGREQRKRDTAEIGICKNM